MNFEQTSSAMYISSVKYLGPCEDQAPKQAEFTAESRASGEMLGASEASASLQEPGFCLFEYCLVFVTPWFCIFTCSQ